MRTFHGRTADVARGRWRGILMQLGIPESFLEKKNGPCPVCGGTDRFSFDDQDGRGTFFCRQDCGAGDGMKLAMLHLRQDFQTVADRIDEIVRNVKPDSVRRKPAMAEEDRRQMLRALWNEAMPLTDGDLVSRYLASRGLATDTTEIRFNPRVRDGDGGVRPCMIARVLTPDGRRAVTLHRTFLRPDGLAKAEMETPRKLMPGTVSDGSAIRLGPVNEALGVAEGIETALAASQLFELPVWATINTAIMEKWTPPEGVTEVCVFADNDANNAGQAAAYRLAQRLCARGLEANVKVPPNVGEDWNDVLRTAAIDRTSE